MKKVKKFKKIYKNEGINTATKKLFNFIGRHICGHLLSKVAPKRGNAILNDVEVPPSEKRPKLKYEKYIPFYTNQSNKNYSGGEINGHKKFTKEGDDVVIIGGGIGISAVRASQLCNPGKVYVYEASQYYTNIVKRVLALNNINNCEVLHGLVGSEIKVWKSNYVGKKIDLKDLPHHDVLEMDCEGAEYEILDNFHRLSKKPHVLIIEIHPHHAEKNPKEIFENLGKLGYEIKYRATNQGKEITKKELREKLNQLYEKKNEIKGYRPDPPVIGAVLKDSK